MAAGLGFKTFQTGEVLTASDVNGYLMQGILVFATEAARNSAITSPQEGQFAFTKDNNSLWYYTGSAWVASGATGDIEGVTAGVGISGGGTSGTVTITNSMATAIDAKGDLVVGTGADAFSRLAVGTNGKVLSANSAEATGLQWITVSSALTLITSGTLSGTTISLDNVFSATYDSYLLCWIVTTTDGEQRIRFRASGSDNTSANYRYANAALDVGATPNFATLSGSGGTDFTLGLPAGVGSNRYGYCLNILSPYDSTVTTKYNGTFYRGANGGGFAYGAINSNTSFDGITVYNTGSTWSGTYQVYGYAK